MKRQNRICNWSEFTAGLKQRGSLTLKIFLKRTVLPTDWSYLILLIDEDEA